MADNQDPSVLEKKSCTDPLSPPKICKLPKQDPKCQRLKNSFRKGATRCLGAEEKDRREKKGDYTGIYLQQRIRHFARNPFCNEIHFKNLFFEIFFFFFSSSFSGFGVRISLDLAQENNKSWGKRETLLTHSNCSFS